MFFKYIKKAQHITNNNQLNVQLKRAVLCTTEPVLSWFVVSLFTTRPLCGRDMADVILSAYNSQQLLHYWLHAAIDKDFINTDLAESHTKNMQ